jgi:hypothetical protein
MKRRSFMAGVALACGSVLALFGAIAGCGTALAASGPTTVSAFYSTTYQNDLNWPKTNYAKPPQVSAFPAGTSRIAFYFPYADRGGDSYYIVVIRAHNGPSYTAIGSYTLSAKSTAEMVWVAPPHGGSAFPAGTYDADLLVDNAYVMTTSFTVGGGNGGNGASNSASGLTVTAFYATTVASYNNWAKTNFAAPQQSSAYAAHSKYVCFYWSFTGATPKVTQFVVTIVGPNGQVVGSETSVTPNNANSSMMDYYPPKVPSSYVFSAGTYQVRLTVGRQQVATTTFTVASR